MPLAELREESAIQTIIGAHVRGKLCVGDVRDASNGEITEPPGIAIGDDMREGRGGYRQRKGGKNDGIRGVAFSETI